jgi:hypothetical protein
LAFTGRFGEQTALDLRGIAFRLGQGDCFCLGRLAFADLNGSGALTFSLDLQFLAQRIRFDRCGLCFASARMIRARRSASAATTMVASSSFCFRSPSFS